jgi:hypothetical protein
MPYNQQNNLGAGFELLFSNFEQFENEFYKTLYQPLYWRDAIPGASIDTSIHPGANFASYGVIDWVGIGGFVADYGDDVPTVYTSRSKVTVPMAYAGIKGEYSRQDMASYNFAYGGQLDTELAGLMRMGHERHIEGVTMYGQEELGFGAYTDLPGVDVANVPDGASTDPEFSTKTPDEILADLFEIVESPWIDSKANFLPDHLELPPFQYALIARVRIADAVDNTVLDYFKKNNLYTQTTGKEITVVSNPHLAGAGVGGVDRMMSKVMAPELWKMPMPLALNLLPPEASGFTARIFAEYKFGPMHLRQPLSAAYRDSI